MEIEFLSNFEFLDHFIVHYWNKLRQDFSRCQVDFDLLSQLFTTKSNILILKISVGVKFKELTQGNWRFF